MQGAAFKLATALFAALLLSATFSCSTAAPYSTAAPLLTVDGAIGPATSDYLTRNIEKANQDGAPLVLIQINTPGGLDKSMRTIIQSILASKVPIVCLVAPSGARAASAGTYILYACHVAAMAEATNLGAATPVQIAAPTLPKPQQPEPVEQNPDEQPQNESPEPAGGTAMERKAINDAVAYIRGLAQLRGRNVEWAEQAVSGAASLPAEEALEKNVIDLIANTPQQLLKAIDGREITIDQQTIVLDTEALQLTGVLPDWRNEFLATITDPNVAYILMIIGIYGLLLEFYNPGAILPGVTGGISLLIALYAFQVMPISYAGIALLLLGVGLMAAEAMAPSFGILGIGGVIAFVVGSVLLLDSDLPGYQIALPLILAIAVVSAFLFILIISMALKARHGKIVSGVSTMLGELAITQPGFVSEGLVKIQGELWKAHSRQPIAPGTEVTVTNIDGLLLTVEPLESNRESSEEQPL